MIKPWEAADAMCEKLEVLRFPDETAYKEWQEQQRQMIAEAFAPVGDEPYDENLQGVKIALRFAYAFEYEMAKVRKRRHIIGDFDTLEDYEKYRSRELYKFLLELNEEEDEDDEDSEDVEAFYKEMRKMCGIEEDEK